MSHPFAPRRRARSRRSAIAVAALLTLAVAMPATAETPSKTPQTIAFPDLPAAPQVGTIHSLGASATSGMGISYVASGGCAISSKTAVKFTSIAPCSVTASQAGDAVWSAAAPVVRTTTATPGPQSIKFGNLPTSLAPGSTASLQATASSGLPVTLVGSGSCSVTAKTLSVSGAGTCTVVASQSGDTNYLAAADVTRSVTIKGDQTITFAELPTAPLVGSSVAVSATASSGLPVKLVASGGCTVGSGAVKFTSTDTCTVTATQAGNTAYRAAPPVVRTTSPAMGEQVITFASLPSNLVPGTPVTLKATASSKLPVSYVAAGACEISGAVLSPTGGGLCSVTASQAGNLSYHPAVDVTRMVFIKFDQTVPMGSIPTAERVGQRVSLPKVASSGITIRWTASGGCSVVSGPALDLTSVGTCTVTGTASGNTTFRPATSNATIEVAGADCDPAVFHQGANLRGQDLVGKQLQACDLRDADLRNVNLSYADFTGADLSGADLTDADILYADGPNARLDGATLDGAWLFFTELQGSSLVGAHGHYTDFSYVKFTGADLHDADLFHANVSQVNFVDADLSGVVLSQGYLINSNYTGVDFRNATIRNANVSYTNLTDADMTGVDLTGSSMYQAILAGTDLTGATLEGVTSGAITGTPAGLPTGWILDGGFLLFRSADCTVRGPGVDLHGCDLDGANLVGVNLTGADLRSASLVGADLTSAWLVNAQIDGADLTGANLFRLFTGYGGVTGTPAALPTSWRLVNARLIGPEANVTSGNFVGADLAGMDLTGVVLTQSTLEGADLSGTTLSGADLSNTNLRSTDLTGTVMTGANLWGAQLGGADVTGADLSGAALHNSTGPGNGTQSAAIYSATTWCANGVHASSSGNSCVGIGFGW